MSAVPQAAVDAAVATMRDQLDLRGIELTWADIRPVASAVAQVVVAAVQGPIKAEALREAADEFDEFVDVDEAAVKVVRPEVVRHKIAAVLRDAANRIENRATP